MKVTQIGKYSVDIKIDTSVNIELDIAEELQKEIDKEITDKIHQNLLQSQGWHRVMVEDCTPITTTWCKKYIKGPYNCFGHYWYFEDLRDANYFVLKWGTA